MNIFLLHLLLAGVLCEDNVTEVPEESSCQSSDHHNETYVIEDGKYSMKLCKQNGSLCEVTIGGNQCKWGKGNNVLLGKSCPWQADADVNIDSTLCEVHIKTVKKEHEGDLAVTISGVGVEEEKKTELKLVKKITEDDITVSYDENEAVDDSNLTVTCNVTGGSPTPQVTFMLMDNDKVVDNSEDLFTTPSAQDSSSLSSVWSSSFTVTLDHQGMIPCCKAEQVDPHNTENLFQNVSKAANKPLDVLFAPKDLKLSQENKNVFLLEFKCKPKPTKITWKVVDETICKDDLSCEMTVTTDSKLEDEDKDKHFHLKYDESKDVFKARLTLITDEETETLKTNGNFTVTISNGVAQKEVTKSVKDIIKEEEENTKAPTEEKPTNITDEPTNNKDDQVDTGTGTSDQVEESGTNPGVVVVIVIFIIMGLVGGYVLYKRRKDSINEMLPLRNGPSMSSLGGR